jgi:hypothetical protein
MMKLNKVIILSLSLVLVPTLSFSSPFTDNAARYGRAAAFHASRFIVGCAVSKATRMAHMLNPMYDSKEKKYLYEIESASQGSIRGLYAGAVSMSTTAFAAFGPQALNKLTKKADGIPFVKLLAPQAHQSDTAGRFAVWAGMSSLRLFYELDKRKLLPGFLKYLA